MQFIKERDYYKVVRITGPSHNLLSIRLSSEECDPVITPLPVFDGAPTEIAEDDVYRQVVDGLNSINELLGSRYFISEIQFVPSDTKSGSVYYDLIRALLCRIYECGDFVEVA